MRPRRRLTWIIFSICILAVLEGLGYITWHALRLERAEREARASASFQESIRLALWRMESEITPIIAAESARPYFEYLPFYPAERAYTRMWQEVRQGEVLVPSPLLESSGPFIKMHFQVEPDGHLTSPQAPTGNMRDMAESHYVDSEFIVLAGQMLDELSAVYQEQQRRDSLKQQETIVPPPSPVTQAHIQSGAAQSPEPVQTEDSEYKAREKVAQSAQTMNSATEAQRKSRALDNRKSTRQELAFKDAAPNAPGTGNPAPGVAYSKLESPDSSAGRDDKASPINEVQFAGPPQGTPNVEQGPLKPEWRSNVRTGGVELILVRNVLVQGKSMTQGAWVDWPRLRDRLAGSIADLLPAAALSPALDDRSDGSGQRLASVPVRLLPGPVPVGAPPLFTTTHITLIVTWAAVLSAIAAIAVVLRTAMQLSERRGRFVSAVTHELRTPLTTFCLYTEMLSDGMVKDDEARRHYLATLKGESSRLARIVQNVLDYAGIGGVGKRTPGPAQPIEVDELLARITPALRSCAERANMQLVCDAANLAGTRVAADPQTVERILLNLVENAGKYASDAEDRRIHFEVRSDDRNVSLRVRDHGPGVPKAERHRVFHAFHRATRDAQGPKSGLGLGLALARELARELGGKLELNKILTSGAEFRLILPAEAAQPKH